MATTLRTIGYEGASVDGFIAALRRSRVSLLIDVRAVAVSRRKGFSKTALAAALAEAGFCPGPAFTALTTGGNAALIFVVAMLVGMGGARWLANRPAALMPATPGG
jgi:hypothetical protein